VIAASLAVLVELREKGCRCWGRSSASTAEIYADLRPREEWRTAQTREALVQAMSAPLSALPGIDVSFSQVIEDHVDEAVSGVKGELVVKIFGEDPEVLQRLADQVATILQDVPGAKDVSAERLAGQPQVQIAIDRAALSRVGLSVADVEEVIETSLGGAVASRVLEGERNFDLVVKMNPGSVQDVEGVRRIPSGSVGKKLTLGSVADVAVGRVRPSTGGHPPYRREARCGPRLRLAVATAWSARRSARRIHARVVRRIRERQRAQRRLISSSRDPVAIFPLFAAFDSEAGAARAAERAVRGRGRHLGHRSPGFRCGVGHVGFPVPSRSRS
jgi:hypothetical protein